MKTNKKTEHIDLRHSQEENSITTHEHLVEQFITENNLLNDILTNPQIPLKAKQIIRKEIQKYV